MNKALDKIIIAIGALDVGFIIWVVATDITSVPGQISSLWSSIVSFGLPYPEMQMTAYVVFYLLVLLCGVSLLFKRKKLVWLNYVLFPFRLVLVVPTIYPLFYIFYKAGIELGVIASFVMLLVGEVVRIYVVYKWGGLAHNKAFESDAETLSGASR